MKRSPALPARAARSALAQRGLTDFPSDSYLLLDLDGSRSFSRSPIPGQLPELTGSLGVVGRFAYLRWSRAKDQLYSGYLEDIENFV